MNSVPADNLKINTTSPRPTSCGLLNFWNVPAELTDLDQWVIWSYALNKEGKWTKVPHCVPHKQPLATHSLPRIDYTDSLLWSSFANAKDFLTVRYSWFDENGLRRTHDLGLEFVLTANLGIVCIDLDKCHDPATGVVEPWAMEIVNEFQSYTEVSASGKGLHIFVMAEKTHPRCRTNAFPKFEIYNNNRLIAITGHRLPGTPASLAPRQEAIDALCLRVFGPADGKREKIPATPIFPGDSAYQPAAVAVSPIWQTSCLSDEEIVLDLINDDRLYELWKGIYPGGSDKSAEDMALIGGLAWRVGPDRNRIMRLLQGASGRDKWRERRDYLDRTIDAALRGRTEFHSACLVPGAVLPPPVPTKIDADIAADNHKRDEALQKVGKTLNQEQEARYPKQSILSQRQQAAAYAASAARLAAFELLTRGADPATPRYRDCQELEALSQRLDDPTIFVAHKLFCKRAVGCLCCRCRKKGLVTEHAALILSRMYDADGELEQEIETKWKATLCDGVRYYFEIDMTGDKAARKRQRGALRKRVWRAAKAAGIKPGMFQIAINSDGRIGVFANVNLNDAEALEPADAVRRAVFLIEAAPAIPRAFLFSGIWRQIHKLIFQRVDSGDHTNAQIREIAEEEFEARVVYPRFRSIYASAIMDYSLEIHDKDRAKAFRRRLIRSKYTADEQEAMDAADDVESAFVYQQELLEDMGHVIPPYPWKVCVT